MTDGTGATPGAPQQTEQDGAGAESAGATAEASACPHPEAVGRRWGDPISAERQAELQAMRPAGQGPWPAASRREGKSVAVGDWLVVLGPVDQRQQGSVPEAITRQPRTETARPPHRQGAEGDDSERASLDEGDDDGSRIDVRE